MGSRPRSRCTGWSTRPTRSTRAIPRPAPSDRPRLHKTRKKGAGLGLPFAVAMVESTGVPIGLVASAHGGTSMEQWNPAKKEQGGAAFMARCCARSSSPGAK